MEEKIRVKGHDVVVTYNYYPAENRTAIHPGYPSEYEFEEIAGLDPDFFTKEYKEAIEKELDRLAEEEKREREAAYHG